MSKTVFITGSSTGLGRATALLFASQGWQVIATMRSPEKEQELGEHANIALLRLDVTKPDEIDAAVRNALDRGPVDAVFCNAGYDLAGPVEGMSDAQLVDQIDTNLFGVIRTTKAFIPALRAQGSGVFVATTSIGGIITLPFNAPYHATKWGVEGFYEALSHELSGFGVRVKTVAPGGMITDFMSRSLKLARHPAYAKLEARVMAVFKDPARVAGYSTGDQIARVVYDAVTDGKDQVRYVAGEDAKATYAELLKLGSEAFRRATYQTFFK